MIDTQERMEHGGGNEMPFGTKPPPTTPRPSIAPTNIKLPCQHKYRILENNTETIYANGRTYLINVNAVFYCEKCLAIKHVEESIGNA